MNTLARFKATRIAKVFIFCLLWIVFISLYMAPMAIEYVSEKLRFFRK